jgi:hypothetical protein
LIIKLKDYNEVWKSIYYIIIYMIMIVSALGIIGLYPILQNPLLSEICAAALFKSILNAPFTADLIKLSPFCTFTGLINPNNH